MIPHLQSFHASLAPREIASAVQSITLSSRANRRQFWT